MLLVLMHEIPLWFYFIFVPSATIFSRQNKADLFELGSQVPWVKSPKLPLGCPRGQNCVIYQLFPHDNSRKALLDHYEITRADLCLGM